jgi:SagB-type dehydrogenase family enzyme
MPAPPDADAPNADHADAVRAYHEATKHHLQAYARGPGRLDWATQPDPFRRYAGAEAIPLDHAEPGDAPTYRDVLVPGRVPPAPLDRAAVSRLFLDSLALSAWKEAMGTRWALRVNPSSGNLHPTEGYLLCGPVAGLADAPAVFHYAPAAHALERRHRIDRDAWERLTADLPPGTVLVGLASVHWREAWKYGERAFRYCQHDAGHAVAAVALAAAGLGWDCRLLADAGDDEVAALLGIAPAHQPGAGTEPEHPDGLLALFPAGAPVHAAGLDRDAVAAAAAGEWHGAPNALSPSHVRWEAVERVAEATVKPPTDRMFTPTPPAPDLPDVPEAPAVPFRPLVHRRRSAVAMDGVTGTDAPTLHRLLAATLPGRRPLSALPWPPAIHLGLFVHRVAGLAPGLYLYARDPAAVPRLRAALTEPAFLWQRPPGTPEGMDLFALVEEDVTRLAGVLSCHQQIASHGAFSLGMLADYAAPLERYGAWFYRHLFWEAGAVGQVLYLEAEAGGLRATGIGCYFDDPVHRAFGIRNHSFQSLYHFTVGGAVEDTRLQTLPAYPAAGVSRR